MGDWKDLKVDNLPSDILTGKYEAVLTQNYGHLEDCCFPVIRATFIEMVKSGLNEYKYRKLEEKEPERIEKIRICTLFDNTKESRLECKFQKRHIRHSQDGANLTLCGEDVVNNTCKYMKWFVATEIKA